MPSSLDGRLNIITGKKETGKSHLSKLLITSLLQYKAVVVVLDLNGEYTGLGFTSDGKRNAYYNKIHVLTPAQNFKVAIKQLHLNVILNILIHALHLPGTSAREFRRIWQHLKDKGCLTLHELGEAIRNWNCNQNVRDALFSRYYALVNSGFFTDNVAEATLLEECLFKAREEGGAVIINLRNTSPIDRQIVVEYLLGKLVELLTSWRLKAVFLFAEEAHLYLRETYWDDIVTRMRHFGIFTTFITNQPDTIRENIYRQGRQYIPIQLHQRARPRSGFPRRPRRRRNRQIRSPRPSAPPLPCAGQSGQRLPNSCRSPSLRCQNHGGDTPILHGQPG
jgi:hypothetical protein